jgi:hypothetical protein
VPYESRKNNKTVTIEKFLCLMEHKTYTNMELGVFLIIVGNIFSNKAHLLLRTVQVSSKKACVMSGVIPHC